MKYVVKVLFFLKHGRREDKIWISTQNVPGKYKSPKVFRPIGKMRVQIVLEALILSHTLDK